MNKPELIQKIKQLDGITLEEKAHLIELLNGKKYGLVWEDKPEDAEELLRKQLPVLHEVVEKRIKSEPASKKSESGFIGLKDSQDSKKSKPLQPSLFEESDNLINLENQINQSSDNVAPNHILIEGDNLHALTALTFTHEGQIDVIYIDPPYNTGNKDFKYNDSFVDKEDSYRHSKWLSFMAKRLRIAKRLLSEKGVIFISIDDNEQAQLKLLCDDVFLESNFIGNVIWRSSDNSNNDAKQFSSDHNYTLVYSNQNGWLTNKLDRTEDQQKHYKNPDNDPRGPWFDGNPISSPNPRANLSYNITAPNGNVIKPPKNGWRWSKETLEDKMSIGEIYFNENFTNIKRRTYLYDQQGLPPSSLWVDLEQTGHNRQAKYELLKIFPEKTKSEVFATPKPVKLIKRILETSIKGDSIILDFFAGSGSTLQAVMELNQDGSNHKCILVTNNENNICEEVTYERNRRVIQGYTNSKGDWVPGLTNNNLRYYQTAFVPSAKTEANRRRLTQLSTELLQIKEDCYIDITEAEGFDRNRCSIHTNERGKYMLVVYYSRTQIEVTEQLCTWIASRTDMTEKVKIYAFSTEPEVLADDFYEVADLISAVPLPDAIYNAYRATFRTLKLDQKPPVQTLHETSQPE